LPLGVCGALTANLWTTWLRADGEPVPLGRSRGIAGSADAGPPVPAEGLACVTEPAGASGTCGPTTTWPSDVRPPNAPPSASTASTASSATGTASPATPARNASDIQDRTNTTGAIVRLLGQPNHLAQPDGNTQPQRNRRRL
jgi:hypothetical protein